MNSNGTSLTWVVGAIIILALIIPFIAGGGRIPMGESISCSGQFLCYWGPITNGTTSIIPDNENDTMTLTAGSGIKINLDAINDIATISSTVTGGEVNTASNVGTGTGLFKQKTLFDLEFLSLTSFGDGIVLTGNPNDVQLSLNAIPKTEISATGTFNWSEISKTGSSIHDLSNVTSTGCASGQILKVSGSSWVCAADNQGAGGTHTLLDGSTHTDTVAQTPSRGSIIYGDTSSLWNELVIGSVNKVLHSNGTDISWQSLIEADIPTLSKSKISTTGTWVEADIPTLSKSKISPTGTFPWSEISKSSSSIHHISNVTSSGCAVNQILKVNSTGIFACAADNTSAGGAIYENNTASSSGLGQSIVLPKVGVNLPFKGIAVSGDLTISSNTTDITIGHTAGSGITSINSDTTAAQLIQGVSANTTVSTSGGTTTVNLGNNVLFTSLTQIVTNKSINADSNTITNIEDADIKSGANIGWSKISKSGSSIHHLSNVTEKGCAENQILKVNSTGDFACAADNTTASFSLNDLTDVIITSPAYLSTLFYNGVDWIDKIFSINSISCGAGQFLNVLNNQTGETACATPTAGGALDDVLLQGIEISNSRPDLNFNDTSVINFNVQDSSGTTSANITATIVTGSIGNTELGTGLDAVQIGGGGVTSSEFDFLADVTSLIQAQLNGKQASLGYTAGTLDDVLLENIEVSNSRANLNYNDTATINFSINDDPTKGQANVTASVVSGSIDDAELGTSIDTTQLGTGGVTSTEFGYIGTLSSDAQTQITARELLSNKNQNNGYAGLGSTGQLQKAQQNATTVYTNQVNTYSGANLQNFTGSAFDNVASINDNSGAESTSGFIDMNNAVLLCWEQSPAAADICISVDVNEDYLLDTDARNFNFNSNPITNAVLGGQLNLAGNTFLNTATITFPAVQTTLTGDNTTNTITNKIIRADGTGNSISADPRIAILTAGGATLQVAASPAKATIDGTNMDYITLDFDTTVAETAIWNWEIPSDADTAQSITAVVSFQVAAGTAGVCFNGSFLGRTAGETVDATFGTVIGACDSSTGTNAVETATLTFTSGQHGLAAGDIVFFKLTRNVADGTDTNAGDSRVIDVKISWS